MTAQRQSMAGPLWLRGATLLLAAAGTLVAAPGQADWVNLSGAEVAPHIAEVYVEPDRVRVELEVYPPERAAFADLLSSAGQQAGEGKGRAVLSVETPGGCALAPTVESVETRERKDRRSPYAGMINPTTGVRAPAPPPEKEVIHVEITYAFADCGQPDAIVVAPPVDGEGIATATIGFIAYHAGVPVTDFRYLGSPATLRLDWDDPWYSAFDNPNLRRHHRYPVMSFIYAEPFEIRHEVLLRVRDAAELIDLRPSGATLQPGELEHLVAGVPEVIADRSPMTIDGALVIPDFDRAAFMRIGLYGLELLEDGDPVDVDASILGLIFSAPVDGLPKTATVEWTLFTDRIREVPSNAIDAAGPLLGVLTPDDPVNVWTNHFKRPPLPPVEEIAAAAWSRMDIPALSLVLWLGAPVAAWGLARRRSRRLAALAIVALAVGGALALPVGHVSVARPTMLRTALSDEAAQALAQALLANVYLAFDFKGEEQVYDRLAKTVDGPLLERIYLEQRAGLSVARAGGAQARVKQVQVGHATARPLEGAAGFVVRARWTILGSVGHWGHIHQRQNAYEADLTIEAIDDAWKVTGFEVVDQERLALR